MALDREDTLRKAEKLLRQGRLDAAIAEYVRVVEDQPRDWNTANTLGDLYIRAGQTAAAVTQFARIAEHFMREGFYPKAGALFKKILKISPDDEAAQLSLAEISVKQGLLVDAKTYFSAVALRRRARGDRRGADEIVLRLGELDPADVEARLAAARVLAHSGDGDAAAARFRQIYEDLNEKGRKAEGLEALREAVRFNPNDREGRALLAREALAAGDHEAARGYLDRETAGDDPALMLLLADGELRAGRIDTAIDILPKLLALDKNLRNGVVELAWTLAAVNSNAALICVDAVVDAAIAASELGDAATILEEFVARVPNHIPALLKLVEICVDGGLESNMYEAQAQLADAYLAAGQAGEARVIAEDLVAREPWDQAHIDRFRRALVLLNVPDPDHVIAERLGGHRPFVTTAFTPTAVPDDYPEPEREPQAERTEEPAESAAPEAVQAAATSPEPAFKPKRTAGDGLKIDITKLLKELEPESPAALSAPAPDLDSSAPPADLEGVFEDFRSEVLTRQPGQEDAAQHMSLANTYLEMGMDEDAIESLRKAARSPRHRFDAATRVARLLKKRGDVAQAVEWMERAAEAPAPSSEAGLALLYDLGETLESMGETARALAVFMELQADAGQYRDVSERVERLSRVQTGG